MSLLEILQRYRIVLTCGTGGVGKTTTAAAIALAAARGGRHVLVLTVDPARRLADALGIDLAHPEPVRVWPADPSCVRRTSYVVETAELPQNAVRSTQDGFLDALMLDTKRTFDRLIERYAPDPATARTILTNPLYRYLSTLIAGSQEYMAMETLYEMATGRDYDLIVVDTPPASHAVDFIRGPQRLIHALTDSMLQFFLKPSMAAGKFSAKLLSRSADLLMAVFGRLAGAELMQEVADFLMSTVGLFGGFRERAEAVQCLLRDPATMFLLVATPQPAVIEDAIGFLRDARREELHLGGAIVNRGLPPLLDAHAVQAMSQESDADQALLSGLRHNAERYYAQWCDEQRCTQRLRAALPRHAPVAILPMQETPMTSIDGLQVLARLLECSAF